MNCKLCEKKEADKKGSHIITDYILRSMLVDGDTSKRSDKIISNQIDVYNTSLFFGREINQEKLINVLGHDMSEEEYENNKNPFTIDFVFCSECENRFSYLETLFKREIYDKIKSINSIDKSILLKPVNVNLFKLFWISIIWRCSIVKFQSFSIDTKSNKRLQKILQSSLGKSVPETEELIFANKEVINYETIGLLYAPIIDDYLSNLVFCNPFNDMPYSLVLNDFYITFYSKFKHVNVIKQSLYNLERTFEIKDYLNEQNCESIKIGLIPTVLFKESRTLIYGLKADAFKKRISMWFSNQFKLIVGNKPSNAIVNDFINDVVINDEVSVYERYSRDRIIRKIKDNIIKYIG